MDKLELDLQLANALRFTYLQCSSPRQFMEEVSRVLSQAGNSTTKSSKRPPLLTYSSIHSLMTGQAMWRVVERITQPTADCDPGRRLASIGGRFFFKPSKLSALAPLLPVFQQDRPVGFLLSNDFEAEVLRWYQTEEMKARLEWVFVAATYLAIAESPSRKFLMKKDFAAVKSFVVPWPKSLPDIPQNTGMALEWLRNNPRGMFDLSKHSLPKTPTLAVLVPTKKLLAPPATTTGSEVTSPKEYTKRTRSSYSARPERPLKSARTRSSSCEDVVPPLETEAMRTEEQRRRHAVETLKSEAIQSTREHFTDQWIAHKSDSPAMRMMTLENLVAMSDLIERYTDQLVALFFPPVQEDDVAYDPPQANQIK